MLSAQVHTYNSYCEKEVLVLSDESNSAPLELVHDTKYGQSSVSKGWCSPVVVPEP